MRWRVRWSLRLRLTAAFVVVTVIAVAAISIEVLPTLESSMAQQRLRTLARETGEAVDDAQQGIRATSTVRPVPTGSVGGSGSTGDRATTTGATPPTTTTTEGATGTGSTTGRSRPTTAAGAGGGTAGRRPVVVSDQRLVETIAVRTGGWVGVLSRGPDDLLPVVRETSRAALVPSSTVMSLAGRALDEQRLVLQTDDRDGALRAVVAVPVPPDGPTSLPRVAVVSEGLADVQATVSLVRRRVLIGGMLGILAALIAGAVMAVGVSARLRRLEHGSREVAAGRFTTRFNVEADDELGSLARSLDTMQRQLAELDNSRKRFIATASHELRTPLQSLSGFVELLRDEDLDEETRRSFLERLATQINRLTRLSGDLLDLSRLESGGVDLRPEDTDLHELAQQVAGEFRPIVERDGRPLRVRLIGPAIIQRCDPDRVGQLLRILVDNAIKHSGDGDAVEIRVDRRGGVTRIAVSDHGPGIPPEELPRIFDPFHGTGTGGGSGAGLGLAIARELANRMRGSLRVESEPGTTSFVLELPA